jgi:hypothetical protein
MRSVTRSAKARLNRLTQLEAEFEPLLLACLREAANGRCGLFGHNDHLDHEHRYLNWPEAQRVVEMAGEIQGLRSEAGESNLLAERLLRFRALQGSNAPGEPKLAKQFLEELT